MTNDINWSKPFKLKVFERNWMESMGGPLKNCGPGLGESPLTLVPEVGKDFLPNPLVWVRQGDWEQYQFLSTFVISIDVIPLSNSYHILSYCMLILSWLKIFGT